MASFTKSIAAGTTYAFLSFVDENGFWVGSGTSAPANGAAGAGCIRILGIKTASPTVPERDVVQVTGDDDLLGEFDFASLTSRSFVIEVAVQDLELEAKLLGTTVQSLAEIKWGGLDIDNPAELSVGLIIQSRAKKQDTGVQGQKGWSGVILPIAAAAPLGRDAFTERTPGVFRLQVTPQKASNTPWGITISSANLGKTGPRYLPFDSEYPITAHAHSGNGSLQTFTLDLPPVSAAKTSVVSARVAQTVSSVSTTSPYSATISGTPIGGAQMLTTYEFNG